MAIYIPTLSSRLLSLVICLSLLLGQTACAQESQDQQPKNTEVPSSAQPAASINMPEKQMDAPQSNVGEIQAENAIITFTAYEFERSMYEPLMAQFHEQNQTITVKFVPMPLPSGDGAANYFRTLASTADTSLVFGGSTELGSYFRDLQPQIDVDADFAQMIFGPMHSVRVRMNKGAPLACRSIFL